MEAPRLSSTVCSSDDASFVYPRPPFPNALRASSESAALLGQGYVPAPAATRRTQLHIPSGLPRKDRRIPGSVKAAINPRMRWTNL